jgi:hypothetical protein
MFDQIFTETLCFVCRQKMVALDPSEPSMKLFKGDGHDYLVAGVCPRCKEMRREWEEKQKKGGKN